MDKMNQSASANPEQLLQAYAALLKDNQDPKTYFKKKKYSPYFEEYCQKQEEVFTQIKTYWAQLAGSTASAEALPEQTEESKADEKTSENSKTREELPQPQQEFLIQLAHAIAAAAGHEIEELRGIKKGSRQSELNLFMVTSVFPCTLKLWPEQGEALCQEIVKEWKKVFPETELGYADYEKLNAGFRSFWGFFTGR
ncbi:MAG: hypothetical protein HFI75_03285 [Lachnospiraceae bacterium]|nr:hypothetical protein [Lachnospiraceae bacterium]